MRERCEPPVVGVRFDGAADAGPRPVCSTPSPTPTPCSCARAIRSSRSARSSRSRACSTRSVARRDRVVGVSPIIAGRPVKGPADRLMGPLGIDVSCVGVAREYRDFCSTLVIDTGRRGARR